MNIAPVHVALVSVVLVSAALVSAALVSAALLSVALVSVAVSSVAVSVLYRTACTLPAVPSHFHLVELVVSLQDVAASISPSKLLKLFLYSVRNKLFYLKLPEYSLSRTLRGI